MKTTIAAAQKAPKWVAPGPAVSASVLKGKKLLVFPINSAISACSDQAADFEALGKSLGADVTKIQINGSPQSWDTAIEQATSGHYAAVAMLCGIIPGAVTGPLTAAQHAGVKIVDGNYNETTNYTGLGGETAVNTAQGVQDDLADSLINLNGKPAHVLFVDSPQVIQYAGAKAGLAAAIKKDCPSSCTSKEVDVQIQNWATPTEQSQIASALTANPDINTVIVTFDGMTPGLITAVQQAAAKHPGIKIYAWGGGLQEETYLQTNQYMAADAGPDERWDAYDAMDQVIRLVSGKPSASVAKEIDPNVFFTKSNVSSFFGPGKTYGDQAFGGKTFVQDFDKLWGVS